MTEETEGAKKQWMMVSTNKASPSLQEVMVMALAAELPDMPNYFKEAKGSTAQKEQRDQEVIPYALPSRMNMQTTKFGKLQSGSRPQQFLQS